MLIVVIIIGTIALASVITDYIIFKQIKKLLLLDKRQQTYISNLLSYNTKIIVLQKLFFCITLIQNDETKQIGIQKLKNNFELPENFEINSQNLILQFQKMLKTKQFSFMVKDGKYIIK